MLRRCAIDAAITRGIGPAQRRRCLAAIEHCRALLERGATHDEQIEAAAMLATAPDARQRALPLRR